MLALVRRRGCPVSRHFHFLPRRTSRFRTAVIRSRVLRIFYILLPILSPSIAIATRFFATVSASGAGAASTDARRLRGYDRTFDRCVDDARGATGSSTARRRASEIPRRRLREHRQLWRSISVFMCTHSYPPHVFASARRARAGVRHTESRIVRRRVPRVDDDAVE